MRGFNNGNLRFRYNVLWLHGFNRRRSVRNVLNCSRSNLRLYCDRGSLLW